MKRTEIIQLRLHNQGLSTNRFATAEEIVAHFGAMQAQDYAMSLWAIGVRLKNSNRSAVEQLINEGVLIRTHILRPTWHLVHQQDVRWMLELSAPHVKKATQYVDKREGLTDALFTKAWKITEQAFNGKDNLTKDDIMSLLAKRKMPVSNLLATQFIIRAELEMRLCNGTEKGTYALFEKRVPATGKTTRTEAIARLTKLYFASRGPATLKDFAWWSGLSLTEAKTGISEWNKKIERIMMKDTTYYYFETADVIAQKANYTLLPCYDEYTVGYSEGRSIALPADSDAAEIGNGIFKPLILDGHAIAGTWRRMKKSPFVDIQSFAATKKPVVKKVRDAIDRFVSFDK